MTTRLIISGIVGGIILFIWSAVSWMALPWHKTTLHAFNNEVAVAQVMQTNATQSGIYLLPSMQMKDDQQPTKGPLVFAAIHQEGMGTMNSYMIIGLITQIIAAFLVSWLLSKTAGFDYLGRVGFVIIFALSAGVVTELPYWNWFHFETQYTLVMMAELLIGWFLAGLAMAAIVNPNRSH